MWLVRFKLIKIKLKKVISLFTFHLLMLPYWTAWITEQFYHCRKFYWILLVMKRQHGIVKMQGLLER